MNTLETIKKLYKKFPNLTVKELIDILECVNLKDHIVYGQPLLRDPNKNIILDSITNTNVKDENFILAETCIKDIDKFKSEDIFDKNY